MAIYTIKADENIIYDPRSEELQVFDPKLTLEVNKTGELKFKIYSTHKHYNKLTKCKTIITVLEDNKVIFKGRITEDTRDFNNGKQVDCEGLLAFLNDSIYRPFTFQGSPIDLFIALINNHNEQVEEWQRFKIGRITVKDNNDYINRESNTYLKTWEVFKTRLLDTLGGYIQVRYENDGMYLDWLEDFTIENADGSTSKIVSTQKIEFGKNLLSVKQTVKAPLATAIIPLGAKIKNEETNTETQLTIESLEDEELDDLVKKGDMIYSKSGVAQYGFIFADVKETTWEDVTLPENLYRKGKELLSGEAVKLTETIELSATDLQNLNANTKNFNYCEYIQVSTKPHGIEGLYLLSKITKDLKNPQNIKITLGETKLTLTDQNVNFNNQITNNINTVEKVIKDYTLNELVTVRNETLTTITGIIQDNQKIIFAALEEYVSTGNFEEYQKIVSARFEQTAKDFTFLFDTAISKVNTLDGDTQAQFQEIQKYIRFVDGNIVLGETGNEITLKIQNDRISFLQNNLEVAYLNNNKLYVTDGEFLNSLQIGKFAFRPRANGSLSFGKVRR